MNVNPHLHYIQQQHPQPVSAPRQSPQLSQLLMQHQHQLQQQRQQLLNQHLQQQQQQQHGSSTNPLLAALNGQASGQMGTPGSTHANMNFNQNINPIMQLQMHNLQKQQSQTQPPQLLQQVPQQRVFSNQHMPQQLHLVMDLGSQVPNPTVKEVWAFNLETEFNALRSYINDKTYNVFISVHQEIPGIVARPLGQFKLASDYHFQCLRSNSDLLNLIQLSLCVVRVQNGKVGPLVIWQFNFAYDIREEMFNEEHLTMLAQTAQINFNMHSSQGIAHFAFAELMMESGLLLDPLINWLSYHSGYDLGFFVSLLTNNTLPNDEKEFFWWCTKYFPNFYDLKHIGNQLLSQGGSGAKIPGNASNISNDLPGLGHAASVPGADASKGLVGNNKPSVEYLAEELHLLPISPMVRQYFTQSSSNQFAGQHNQMTSTLHAYLLMECFKELYRQLGGDLSVFEKYRGYLWGLGDTLEQSAQVENPGNARSTKPVAKPW